MIVVNNIQTLLGEPEEAAVRKALKKLGIAREQVEEAHVTKTSLDARKQSDIRMVHSVAVKLRSRREEEAAAKRDPNAQIGRAHV